MDTVAGNPFAVLTAVVAPAILTNACSVLALGTSNRLARVVDRTRVVARELAALLRGKDAKVNLIPFNAFPGTRYQRSPPEVIARFREELHARGVTATIRRTRGDDIDAACGQLAGRVADRTTVRLGRKHIPLVVQS